MYLSIYHSSVMHFYSVKFLEVANCSVPWYKRRIVMLSWKLLISFSQKLIKGRSSGYFIFYVFWCRSILATYLFHFGKRKKYIYIIKVFAWIELECLFKVHESANPDTYRSTQIVPYVYFYLLTEVMPQSRRCLSVSHFSWDHNSWLDLVRLQNHVCDWSYNNW